MFDLMVRLKTAAFATLFSLSAQGQAITTIAGTGQRGSGGNGGPATGCELNRPFSICTAPDGSIYISDRFNSSIRKIATTGIVTTIAGNGTSGYSDDNIPATIASLADPNGVSADQYGNVYFADHGSNRIRKVAASGIITTVAGNGNAGFNGDNQAAKNAELNAPRGVFAMYNGEILVADAGNHRVRRIDKQGIINTVAGTGAPGSAGDGGPASAAMLYGPYSVTADANGNIYIADVDNQRIRRVSPDGIITTIAGNGNNGYSGDGGPATNAALYEPIAVTTDALGNVLIADGWNNRIRLVNVRTGIIYTIAGNGSAGYGGDDGPATNAALNGPYGVAIDNYSNIYVADYNNDRIRKVVAVQSNAQLALKLFPNPANGKFTIIAESSDSSPVSLIITDCIGRCVYSKSLEANKFTKLEPTLSAGIYSAIVHNAQGTAYQRLVILP